MPPFTQKEKHTLHILLMKVVFFIVMITALLLINFLIELSSLSEDRKEILHGLDFWGTVAYLSYFLSVGIWDLIRIDFRKRHKDQGGVQ